jgi:hypothetical protein
VPFWRWLLSAPLFSAFVVGGMVYGGVATGVICRGPQMTFMECMVFGSLISATDPVTVLSLFGMLGVHLERSTRQRVRRERRSTTPSPSLLYGAVLEFDGVAVTWAGVGGAVLGVHGRFSPARPLIGRA